MAASTNSTHESTAAVALSAEERLHAAGIVLPPARAPIANFAAGVLEDGLLFLSGQGPVTADGKRTGKVGADVGVEDAYQHARLAGLNLLTHMRVLLGSLDRVSRIVKVFGMVNAVDHFVAHPSVIDGCSDLFVEVFGANGVHARSAIGVSSLPGNITVEIEAIVAVRPSRVAHAT